MLTESYVHLYTGNGKGKTTAALGLATRALGAGFQVFIGQFVKGAPSSEFAFLRQAAGERLTFEQFGLGGAFRREMTMDDARAAQAGLARARDALTSGAFDLVVLDEITVALRHGLLSLQDVLSLIEDRAAKTELVLTGRGAPPELRERADLVTEMTEVKHYFHTGVMARTGIEN